LAPMLTVEGEKSGEFGSWLYRHDPTVVNDDLLEQHVRDAVAFRLICLRPHARDAGQQFRQPIEVAVFTRLPRIERGEVAQQ